MKETRLPSQATIIGRNPPETWQELARDCQDAFGGGYQTDEERRIFHHGIRTAFNLIEAEFPSLAEVKAIPALIRRVREAEAAEEELAAIRSFTPTPGAINALPDPLRQYIHDLETRCDPAGEVAELVLTRDQNAQLQARLDIAEAKVRRVEVLTNLWANSPGEADFPSGSNYRAAAVALHAASRLVLEVLSGD